MTSSAQTRAAVAEIDQKTLDAMRRIQPVVESKLDGALDHFYAIVSKNPAMRRFFSSDQQMGGAKSKQKSHWEGLARGEIGEAHAQRTVRIGHAHVRIGLEPNYFVAGYGALLGKLVHDVITDAWPKSAFGGGRGKGKDVAESVDAVIRLALLDMEMSIMTYLDELTRQAAEKARQEQEERAVAMRSLVLGEIGSALNRLADGDLSQPITADIPPEFASVKNDFNRALESLATLVSTVRGSAQIVDSGAGEIATASDDLSRRTEQQAASLEETAAALSELSQAVDQSSRRAGEASSTAKASMQDARGAEEIVKKAVEAMSRIETSSTKIGMIIGVIDEIAFQTNLLALNAGVEAARAGEAGRGFAVVAQEVRGLAQRSAEAAKEIKGLIQASSDEIGVGVDLVGNTGMALSKIVERAREIESVVDDIARTAGEQATAISEVNTAINQMDQSTQQNAAMVEQSAAVAGQLRQGAAELMEQMTKLKIADAGRSPGRSLRRVA